MKNNKGFTLVEVLAVITILGILALISVPAMNSVIRSSKQDAYEEQKGLILNSAKAWAAKNVMSLPNTDGEVTEVTLGTLKKSGAIEIEIRNPLNDMCFSNDTIIVITRNGNGYTYGFKDEDNIEFVDSEDCRVD